ncbi:hypothetical protein CPB85DRAFT_1331695 [Mucidula mucida]|nr:hypothetical protein CPB85DRAFT_1331695 [Mucidula mucida]
MPAASIAPEARASSPQDSEGPYTGPFEPTFTPPAGVDITKPASVVQYCEKLADDAIKARLQPLHVGWSFEAEIKPHARARARPRNIVLMQKTTFRFELHRALQPYNPRAGAQWSQVWVAALTDREITDAERIGVVLKIIQPSLLPHPRYDDETLKHYRFPEHVAKAEDVIYQKALANVQGGPVPYYFGKTKVIMPSGEEADVLVFEAIGGETVQSWVQRFEAASKKDADLMIAQLPRLTHAITHSYRRLGERLVLHRDVCLENMIWTIVDFGDSCLRVSESILDDEDEGWNAGAFVIGHCRLAYPSFKVWAANEGKAMIAEFHMEGWDTK